MTSPQIVRTLLGEKTLAVSLACLPTLVNYSTDQVRLVAHEDGTLTETSREALVNAVPGVEILNRSSADALVLPQLDRYPLCLKVRMTNPLFLKVFDLLLVNPNAELVYCDSDVLFQRPFSGLFGTSNPRYDVCFMHDCKDAYAIRPWHLWPMGKLRLAGRVNTGLIRAAAGLLDLDFLEWMLNRLADHPVWARRSYWAEQTCWAALAGRANCGLWDPKQVILANSAMTEYSREVVAIHFVSTYRNHLPDYLNRGLSHETPPINIEASAASRVGPFGQFLSDLRGRYMTTNAPT